MLLIIIGYSIPWESLLDILDTWEEVLAEGANWEALGF